MNTYLIYIKSHCEAPDFEEYVEAATEERAIQLICEKYDWSRDIVKDNIIDTSLIDAYK